MQTRIMGILVLPVQSERKKGGGSCMDKLLFLSQRGKVDEAGGSGRDEAF